MNENLVNKLPVDYIYIKELHRTVKNNCIQYFKNNIIGDEFDKYKVNLLDKIKSLYNEIIDDNYYAFKEQCEDVLSNLQEEIEKSIDNHKIDSIEQLMTEIKNIESKYATNFPNIPQKKEIWLQYVSKWIESASQILNSYNIKKLKDIEVN